MKLKWFIQFILIETIASDWPDVCKNNTLSFIRNEYCYSFVQTAFEFQQARDYCTINNGMLMIPKDMPLLSKLSQHHKNKHCSTDKYLWMGARQTRQEKNSPFINVDNSSLVDEKTENINTSMWATGEPDYRSHNNYYDRYYEASCVTVNIFSAKLHDDNCRANWKFYCQYTSIFCNVNDINITNAMFENCYENKEVPYGFTVNVKCHTGYYLRGPSKISCDIYGKWSKLPVCVFGCPKLALMPNADLMTTYTIHEVGTKAVYMCNDDYVSVSNPRRSHFESFCDETGAWNPPLSGCIHENQYNVHFVKEITGKTLFLDCILDNQINENLSGEKPSFLWIKNSKIFDVDVKDVELQTNGTLILSNIKSTTAGYYFCFEEGKQIYPAEFGYQIEIQTDDCDISEIMNDHATAKEGQTALLLCPHNHSQQYVNWYKDDKLFIETGDQTVYPDGSLYFKNLTFQNQGIYTCQIKAKDSTCTSFHKTELTFQTTTKNICGRFDTDAKHPWSVTLWLKDEIAPFCYGTLINEKLVITTAQCLSGFNRKRKLDIFVRFNSGVGTKDSQVRSVRIHSKFSKKQYVNDIGLILLKDLVVFSKYVRPICLSGRDFLFNELCDQASHINGTVIGWGSLEKDDYEKLNMLTESVTIIKNGDGCFSLDFQHHDKMFCAKKIPGTPTTFAGDSGATLEVNDNGRVFLLGIYSWGDRLSSLGTYDYYTKVSEYMPWINNLMNNNEAD